MVTAIKRAEEILAILVQACSRRELLILVTPYLRFESSFVAIEKGELHVRATMTREDASYSLRTPELLIRFPLGLGFLEAPVKMLGLGLFEGKRTVRLSIPKLVTENDHRSAYRVERVGRVLATYSTTRGDLLQASLVDISTNGARLHAQKDLDISVLKPGASMRISIPLAEDIRIEAKAEIRHIGPRSMGLEFIPGLPPAVEEPLSRWVFLRREEDRERLAQRLELNDRSARGVRPGDSRHLGILLFSSDPELEEGLREALLALERVTRLPLTSQAVKDGLASEPPLVVFHVNGTGLDERRRLKALVEGAVGKVPTLLLGTQVDGSYLFELSAEWRTSSAIVWNPARGIFLQRLAQGIIRRHKHGGDSPMAPAEGSGGA